MRVYIKYEPEEGSVPEHARGKTSLKIKLPASYVSGPITKVKDLFVEHHVKKHGGALTAGEVTVVLSDGRRLADDAITGDFIHEHDEVRMEYGPPPAKTTAVAHASLPPTGGDLEHRAEGGSGDALLQCRNYGCMKRYHASENSDTACTHHTAPPLFREGKKQWSCCPHASGWDWEEFMAIPGCVVGPHSTEAPGATFAVSPTVAAAAQSAETTAVKSIDQFNAENPLAPSSLTSLAKSMAADAPKKLVVRADGKKQCVHFGCQQFFDDVENEEGACRYHRAGPVFHEGMKYWGCCPGSKHIDFDEFLAQPGCQTGKHEAGTEPV